MVQVNPTKLFLRFKFKKTGSLQYISHLDLVRTMHKIIVRAGLPLWYTEGFNPKPKMIFAAPLSIGTESVCEFMDIRLNEYMDPAEAMARLNANMTAEMQVSEAYYPDTKFTDLAWLSYTIIISTSGASEALASACEAALNADKVELLKKTKSGEAVVDIRPLIKSADAVYSNGDIRISCVLSADPSAFLNPEYIIKALREKCSILPSDDLASESYSIMRERAYQSDMSEFK